MNADDVEAYLVEYLKPQASLAGVTICAGPDMPAGYSAEAVSGIKLSIAAGLSAYHVAAATLDVQFQVFGRDSVAIRALDRTLFEILDGASFSHVKRMYRLTWPIIIRDYRTKWQSSVCKYRVHVGHVVGME